MKLESINGVMEYLVTEGMATKIDKPFVRYLSGGVSCRVWKVVLNENSWVIKQALEKLNVKSNWIADVERIHREHRVMEALRDLIAEDTVPKVLHTDYANHIYIMESAQEGARTWKELLMEGNFAVSIVTNTANILRQIHLNSNRMSPEAIEEFQDQKYFIQLRIEPFHRFLMHQYPELSFPIQKLIEELTLEKTCLVHGDFSPKNILVEDNNHIVLIDFEVAHWGNPVFDVAYCIGHLMLKGWYLKKQQEVLKLIEVFLKVYNLETSNLIPHLGLMLLARIDGKSPVNYIMQEDMKMAIRKLAVNWIEYKEIEIGTYQKIREAF
jgi:5-methylthioribose kinase